MPFDPSLFEAQVALELIPTEKLPSVAQDAMEADFDGPCVVRMAILGARDFSEIDQALLPMLAELGLRQLGAREAALRVAVRRAEEILASGEDPLLSAEFFFRLMLASDYISELIDLGNMDDLPACGMTEMQQREFVLQALRELISPDLRQEEPVDRRAGEARFRRPIPTRNQGPSKWKRLLFWKW